MIDELEQVVIAAGGHNAAAARLGLSTATLSRWRRCKPPYPSRLTALIALLRKAPAATTFSRTTSEATRERMGITEHEYKSLLEMNPGASRSATIARRQTSKLRTAAYVSGAELEAIRTQAGVSLSLAARALGYAKTSLFRLERGLISQYLVIVARERLPAISSLLAERDPTERLHNVIRALALGHNKARVQLRCDRLTWKSLASSDAHATAKRLLVINGLAHLSYRDAVAIVDGSFFRGQRLRTGSTLTEWAHTHSLATTTYQRIERSHGYGALFTRISSAT